MKNSFLKLTAAAAAVSMIAGCGTKSPAASAEPNEETEKPVIVSTNFAEYDFVRAVAGDTVENVLLLKPGAESHSYEPTPQDIITIQNASLFLYVGGDSDDWVEGVLDSMGEDRPKTFRLMDTVDLYEEEHVEGMEEHDHDHDHEHEGEDHDHEHEEKEHEDHDYAHEEENEEHDHEHEEHEHEMDEHVWTSPVNAIRICEKLSEEIQMIVPEQAETVKANTAAYVEELTEIDGEFRAIVENAKRKEIVVADRYPFRYFSEEYGLKYYAAFPGCSSDTEASASTVAFLIDKVKADEIPVVFHIELSNEKMCDTIVEATGARKELLNAVHNVSADEFEKGVTYADLMRHNVEVLREALN